MARQRQKITLFTDDTADRILKGLPGIVEKGKSGKGNNTKFSKEEQYEVLTAKIISDDDNGYYTCEEVILNNSDMDEANHDFEDKAYLRKDIKVRETASTTGIAVDTIVKLTPEAMIDKTIIWTFTQGGGGGGVFSVVRLVNAISYSEYTGYVQSSSDPATRFDQGSLVTIKTIVTMGSQLATGTTEFHVAYLEDGVYYIADVAVFK